MSQIRRPAVQLPPAPKEYNPQEEQEFRRIVARLLSESVEDSVRQVAQASLTIPAQAASNTLDRYYYSWTATGFPVTTTYTLRYRYIATLGTLVEEGVVENATSGDYIQSTGNIGATPFYSITVTAFNEQQILATASRVGLFDPVT